MRRTIALSISAVMLFGVVAGAGAAPKPAVMFTDDSGDADNEQGTGQSVPGGFDLVEGTISKKGKDLEFVVTHADMPPTGSLGEAFRLLYHFGAGSEQFRFTVKSLDIGKPDALAGGGTERIGQVYPNGVARLEQCEEVAGVGVNLVQCNTSEYLDAVFDPAAKTVTWLLPISAIKGKKGMLITAGTDGASSTNCVVCWVPHKAERSLTPSSVIDAATITGTFKL